MRDLSPPPAIISCPTPGGPTVKPTQRRRPANSLGISRSHGRQRLPGVLAGRAKIHFSSQQKIQKRRGAKNSRVFPRQTDSPEIPLPRSSALPGCRTLYALPIPLPRTPPIDDVIAVYAAGEGFVFHLLSSPTWLRPLPATCWASPGHSGDEPGKFIAGEQAPSPSACRGSRLYIRHGT